MLCGIMKNKLSVGFEFWFCAYLACLTSCSCSIAIVVHLLVSNHVLHEEYKILQMITSKFLPMVSGTHWVLSVFLLQNGRFVWTREIWMISKMIFFHTRYLNYTYIEREWEYYNLLQHKDQSPLGGDWTTEDDKKRQNISNNLIRYWSFKHIAISLNLNTDLNSPSAVSRIWSTRCFSLQTLSLPLVGQSWSSRSSS